VNKAKKYCPPQRDLTSIFAKDILAGRKFLLDLDKVNWIEEVPTFKELSTQSVWNQLKNDSKPNFSFLLSNPLSVDSKVLSYIF
jgi:hypothetical protein